jgi:hypothetical protein
VHEHAKLALKTMSNFQMAISLEPVELLRRLKKLIQAHLIDYQNIYISKPCEPLK